MRHLSVIWVMAALAVSSCAPNSPSGPPTVTFTIVANKTLFSVYDMHVARGRPLVLRFVNGVPGEWHGLAVSGPNDNVLPATTIRGVNEQSFDLGVLPIGVYQVTCPIQVTMNATLTVE